MTGFIHEKIFLHLNDVIRNLRIVKSLSFLIESQWWSKEHILLYQEDHLHQIIHHIYDHVPFYKDWFRKNKIYPSDIEHFSDLKKLPILSKKEIRQNPQLFKAEKHGTSKPFRLNSSGSTGEPFEYLVSRDAFSMRYATALRGWFWMGYHLGDFYTKLSQNERSSPIKKIQDIINRCSYIYIPDLSLPSLKKVIQKLEQEKPDYVRCYPDPLMLIARILRSENKYLNGVKAINCTGNILTPENRTLIEERFNCPVFDSYSCEGGSLFYEGPARDSYLGASEYAITEVINSEGFEVNPGETGLHVTTDLWNYDMPFIRYNTQDLVVKSGHFSTCGRQLTNLDKILGRENDILVSPSGNLLIVHLFTIYFEYFNCIKQFQIEQLQPDEFIFRLVVGDSFTTKTNEEIHDYWQKSLGQGVKLTIEIHENIPILYSGKRRFLIRNNEIKLPF